MSSVRDIEIRGIRNFGDESSKARIHLSKPLTLILGANGTGKTTIIEALKFITSGEYPPDSDRGKSFVHEPKLTLNHTVRGQVKAKIVDKNGDKLIVTRTMQVSRQKTGALKFQALDNTITRIDEQTKKKVQISSRCTDVDREILIAMGVSKPILNYVIFCHQEESNWPLEDGKKLKDKFDEIFDTSKYNKAMDTTTKLIKDLQIELNEIKAYEVGLKAMVDEVHAQEDKLKDCERREEEINNRIKEIEKLIMSVDDRIKDLVVIYNKHEDIEQSLKIVETDYKLTKNYIQSLKKHIKNIYTGSKEELIHKIETFDLNLSQKVVKKQEYTDNLHITEKNENILSKKLANDRIRLGSLKQKKIAFDEKVIKRNELLSKSLRMWNVSESGSTITEEEVKDYINEIKKKFEEFRSSMNNKIEENEQEERHVQREVDAHRIEKTAIESEMSLKEKGKNEIKLEIGELKRKIKEAGEAGDKLNSIELNLKNASRNYESLLEDFDEDLIKKNLQLENIKKKELHIKLNLVEQEINSLHQQSSQQAELELYQNNLRDKEKSILALQNKHKTNLNLLFDGKQIPNKKLKEHLEKIQKLLFNEKDNLVHKIEEEQQQIITYETTLKCNQEQLSKMISELDAYKEKIFSKCQNNDYNESLLLQEKKLKSLQDQRGIYTNQSLLYDTYLKLLKKKSCCPLCDREFKNNSEEKKLEQKLYLEIKKNPQCLKDCEKELKEEQTRYDVLQQLKPITENIIELENEKLPHIRKSMEEIKINLGKCEQKVENMNLILSEPDEKLHISKQIMSDVVLLDNYINEKEKLTQLIEAKKSEMLKAGKIGDRCMEDVQMERQEIKKNLSTTEQNIDSIQSNLQLSQEKIQKAREQKNKLNEELLQSRQCMQSLKQLKDKVKDLYEKENFLEESLKSLRQKLVGAEEKLSINVEELNNLKQKNRNEQDKALNFKSQSTTEMHELNTVQKEVHTFIIGKIEESLLKVELDVEETKKEYEDMKVKRLELEEHIRFLDDQCRSQETGKKELESNLELISKEEDIVALNDQLISYRTLLKDMKFDEVKKEYKKLQEQKENFEKEKSSIKGAQGELSNSIQSIKTNLNQEKYRMARHNYKEKQLQLVVQEEAIANLKIYVTVLDKAMIQFHEERMNTVNKIMGQLWNLVYSGNDTSSIQIRVQTTEGIGDKKRSYNYKLVQVKRSTEMDMKGKCSAGQKVLASIIIRMALAETFCTDCAVLALDEPTTNLDEENSTNLAVTLSKVIQLRSQHHKNFQFIVISHDEKFISHLSNLSGKQMFQELYRNIDGYSLIRRRNMDDFIKNNSQTDNYNKLEDDSDDEDEDLDEEQCSSNRKRNYSLEDLVSKDLKKSSKKKLH
ncbi:PREDICTED: DNA repair protein RAD50 [Ceratosolen solmsi marchali]|uniref:DNA repair protein RAD50 n=1 Tax=Ceratosolen solmsi marchali TaxID=326594 RepID=A0AAJ7DWN6_9HYME|nr:PREDICTED: DNA repair protein RAD50 [Ceratosolen solmsi marchali]